jgi:cephalosporin hydroxylase
MNELESLGQFYKTDKRKNLNGETGNHDYIDTYYELLKDHKEDYENILEIGVWFGASHLMWNEFFPNAIINGVDNFSAQFHKYKTENPLMNDAEISMQLEELKNSLENVGIIIHVGSQADKEFLKTVGYDGKYDLICDDGSHGSWDVQTSFDVLWDYVKSGGYYIVEDLAVCDNREFRQFDDPRSATDQWLGSMVSTEPFSYYIESDKLKRIQGEIESIEIVGELGIIKKK